MNDLTIPPEAVEAAARDVAAIMGHEWSALCEDDRELAFSIARAALRAALAAWPGMDIETDLTDGLGEALILPQPQKETGE